MVIIIINQFHLLWTHNIHQDHQIQAHQIQTQVDLVPEVEAEAVVDQILETLEEAVEVG